MSRVKSLFATWLLSLVYLSAPGALLLSALAASAAVLNNGVFEETLAVPLPDPSPGVRLFFEGPVQPASFVKRTETDGTYSLEMYYFQIPEGENQATVAYEVFGDVVGVPSLSGSNDLFDWSSRTGITANPFTMQVGRYYRLTVMSNAPSMLSGRRTSIFYFAVEHGSGPVLPPDNQAPQVMLLPQPDNGFAFQRSLLQGWGFTFYAEDPDGVADLNWESLRVSVAGVDKTAHFLNVVKLLQAENRLRYQPAELGASVFLTPDPTRFMDTHNLFNIQWNGDWPVKVQLCDRSGACASAEYTIYFGPFLSFTRARDLRCAAPATHVSEALLIEDYLLGNTGYAAPLSFAYLGVQRTPADTLWLYYLTKLGYPALSDNLYPLLPALALPAGFYQQGAQIALPLVAYAGPPEDFDTWVLPGGEYRLMAAVVDKSVGALRLFGQALQVCGQ